MAAEYGSLPFREQLAFFLRKLQLPTRAWTDVYAAEHDVAFMVAGAMKASLLSDLHGAVEKAIQGESTIQAFRKEFDQVVEAHGWAYKGGRNWRTRVIYDTNVRQSYNAGREAQMADPQLKKRRPYGLYKHGDSVNPRPQHLAWDGLVLPLDDPWWATHSPQNGWGCKCKKYMLSERDVQRRGLKVGTAPEVVWEEKVVGVQGPSPRVVRVPQGIDPGFEYRPGTSRASDALASMRKWAPEIAAQYATALGAAGLRAVAREYAVWIDEVLSAGRPAGRAVTLWGMEPEELDYLKAQGRPPERTDVTLEDRLVVGKKASRHEVAGDALTPDEWRALAGMRHEAVLYDRDDGRLLYVLPGGDRKIKVVVAPDWRAKGRGTLNSARAVFKVGDDALRDPRRYAIVRGQVEE